jgi:hypothetical protein
MSEKRGSINHFLFFFFLIFHWSPYYVMLCKYEDTQQMVNPDRNKNKDKKSTKVDNQEDSTFNIEETKKRALESVPQIPSGQIPSGEGVTKAENKKEANKHIRKRG